MLEVLEPGLYSTIQDAGREGWGHLGVRRAGAADPLALSAANVLAGNAPDAPVVEMTLLGATFAVRADVLVAVAGADMTANVPEDGRHLAPGASYRLRAGTTLAFADARTGARTYLTVAGGFDVPSVLGSASTDPVAGFGGIDGRALQVGDRLVARPGGSTTERRWPSHVSHSGVPDAGASMTISVVEGPHLEAMGNAVCAALVERTWTVSPRADRVGLRLDGQPIARTDELDLVSLPMMPGAIQVPTNGQPIVLMPDAPTVGGYPVPAVVTSADRHRTGQLKPGDGLRFRRVSLDDARAAMAEQQARFAAISGAMS